MKALNMSVKEIMSTTPVVAYPDDTLSTVLGRMKENNVHELPVIDNKRKIIGYFDYSTVAKRRNISLYSRITNLMIHPPLISENSSIDDVINIFVNSGLRAVPVVDNNQKLVGIVSRTNIVSQLKNIKTLAELPVTEVMVQEPELLSKTNTLIDALNFMRRWDEVTAPVVDDHGKLVGMVHMRDITKVIWHEKVRMQYGSYQGEKNKVEPLITSIMSAPVYVLNNARLKEVIQKLETTGSYMCVVVDENYIPVGLITQRDIIETAYKESEEEGVFVQITGLEAEDPDVYDSIYELVERFLNKINKYKIYRPQALTLHVAMYNVEGDEVKYSVRAKLNTDKKNFFYGDYDWNLYRLFKNVTDQLERMIRKEKDKMLKRRRR